jgi:hypothetical protein
MLLRLIIFIPMVKDIFHEYDLLQRYEMVANGLVLQHHDLFHIDTASQVL